MVIAKERLNCRVEMRCSIPTHETFNPDRRLQSRILNVQRTPLVWAGYLRIHFP
jgi:hypothetical protein